MRSVPNPKASARFLKYAIVGTIAFAIDLGVLLLLSPWMPLLLANTLAFILANVANFLLAHGWVFGRSAEELTFSRYAETLAVSTVGLVLNDAIVWFLAEIAGANLIVTKVVATVIVLAWNYTARVLWVYRERKLH